MKIVHPKGPKVLVKNVIVGQHDAETLCALSPRLDTSLMRSGSDIYEDNTVERSNSIKHEQLTLNSDSEKEDMNSYLGYEMSGSVLGQKSMKSKIDSQVLK